MLFIKGETWLCIVKLVKTKCIVILQNKSRKANVRNIMTAEEKAAAKEKDQSRKADNRNSMSAS
jgi:hypothetical protein